MPLLSQLKTIATASGETLFRSLIKTNPPHQPTHTHKSANFGVAHSEGLTFTVETGLACASVMIIILWECEDFEALVLVLTCTRCRSVPAEK